MNCKSIEYEKKVCLSELTDNCDRPMMGTWYAAQTLDQLLIRIHDGVMRAQGLGNPREGQATLVLRFLKQN